MTERISAVTDAILLSAVHFPFAKAPTKAMLPLLRSAEPTSTTFPFATAPLLTGVDLVPLISLSEDLVRRRRPMVSLVALLAVSAPPLPWPFRALTNRSPHCLVFDPLLVLQGDHISNIWHDMEKFS